MTAKEQAAKVQLCRPSGAKLERTVVFQVGHDVEAQMQHVCNRFKEDYDTDTNYFVLTASTEATSKILATSFDLNEALNAKKELGLWRGEELINNLMNRIEEHTDELEDIDKDKLKDEISGMFHAIRGKPILAEISIETGALEQILKCITNPYIGEGDEELVNYICGFAVEMLVYESADEELRKFIHDNDDDVTLFFRTLVDVLLTPLDNKEYQRQPPYATLTLLNSILDRIPLAAWRVQQCLVGYPADDDVGELENLYPRLVDCIDGEEPDSFVASAGCSILYSLCLAATGDHDISSWIQEELEKYDDDDDDDDEREETYWEQCTHEWNFISQLISLQLNTASELAAASMRGGTADDHAKALVHAQKLQRRLDQMEFERDELKKTVQKQQAAMRSLSPFVNMGNPILQQPVQSMLKFGWDSLDFRGGYSVLHYTAECIPEPQVMDFLYAFAPNPEAADEKGLTPLDYAKKSKNLPMIGHLSHLSFERRKKLAPSVLEPDEEVPLSQKLAQKLAKLQHLQPKLRETLESVVREGWNAIEWPGNFTALHLACRTGNMEAVEFVMEAGGDGALELQDMYQLKPLDYAVQYRHEHVVTGIQELMARRKQEERKVMLGRESFVIRDNLKAAIPAGMDPKLAQAVNVVLERGWSRVKWPSNFSALHLAAVVGDANSIRFLLQASAQPSLTAKDDRGKTPLDYAMNKQREQEILFLLRPPPQETEQTCQALDLYVDDSARNGLAQALEAAEWMKEIERLQTMVNKSGFAASKTPGGVSLSLSISELDFLRFEQDMETQGKDQILAKLQEPRLTGGAELNELIALSTLEQLKFINMMFKAKKAMPGGMEDLGKRIVTEMVGATAAAGGKGGKSAGKGTKGGGKGGGKGAGGKGAAAGDGAGMGGEASAGSGKGGKAGGKGPAPKAKAKVTPTKPKIQPKKKMQALWWGDKPMYFGTPQLEKGAGSIWDEVDQGMVFPEDELVERFTTERPKPAIAASPEAGEGGEQSQGAGGTAQKPKEKKKILKIITDPNDILQKTAALQSVPDPEESLRALNELDDSAMTVDALQLLSEHACPNEEQLEQLKALREQYPSAPFGFCESFLWEFGNTKHARKRFELWHFVRNVEEPVAVHTSRLADYEYICDGIYNSQALRLFFGYVLAVGNYMNGGTGRGQWDGFHVEKALDGMTSCRDKQGNSLTQFVLSSFAAAHPDSFDQLVEDVQSALLNVARRVKQVDGADVINVNTKVNLGDYESIVSDLQKECNQMRAYMAEVSKDIQDASDPFKLRMPKLFEKAMASVEGLIKLRDTCKEKFSKVLDLLQLDKTMQGDSFCLMWDKLFVPESRLLHRSMANKKSKFVIPRFCSDKPFTSDDLLVLWGIKDYVEPIIRQQLMDDDGQAGKESGGAEGGAAEGKKKDRGKKGKKKAAKKHKKGGHAGESEEVKREGGDDMPDRERGGDEEKRERKDRRRSMKPQQSSKERRRSVKPHQPMRLEDSEEPHRRQDSRKSRSEERRKSRSAGPEVSDRSEVEKLARSQSADSGGSLLRRGSRVER